MGFLGLLAVVLALGSVLGFVSFFRVRELKHKVQQLEQRLQQPRPGAVESDIPATDTQVADTASQAATGRDMPVGDTPQDVNQPVDVPNAAPVSANSAALTAQTAKPAAAAPAPNVIDAFFQSLHDHWMVWLGGVCVGLSGVFLVKYGIEKGVLGPAARIALGCMTGMLLHGAAEWLRRRDGQSHPSFAALAGGASIVLYASLLAALHLYQLFSPGLAFTLLAAVAIFTMLLALSHGPILAILGLLGGYVVPLLVSDNSGNMLGAMVYALIISVAGLLLMRYVYRSWLWFGVVAGALVWWLLSFTSTQADAFRGGYLAVFAYALLALPLFDWRLTRLPPATAPGFERLIPFGIRLWQPVQLSLLLILVAQALSIAHESFSSNAMITWLPLIVVAFLAAYARPTLVALPWISLLLQWFAWLYGGVEWHNGKLQYVGLSLALQTQFLPFAFFMAALYSGLAAWNLRRGHYSHWLASLMILAPPLWVALAYLLVTDLSTLWQWSACALMLGSVYIYAANRRLSSDALDGYAIWLVLGGHLTYSIAMAMLFREATLTLTLALQLITLAWLIERFKLQSIGWLVKVVLAVVLLRLTFNPWMLQYPADIHWSLWTYGGATVSCFIAARLTPNTEPLRQWLEAAALQLLVLFIAAELRYWLYDGEIFKLHYSLTEAAINTTLWASLGLVYYYRSQLSTQLLRLYQFASRVLLILAAASYFLAVVFLNPLWSHETVANTVIWNVLLGAYGLPVIMAYACARYYAPNYRSLALLAVAASGFIFINMEIRHLWQGDMDISAPMISGELYTYSIVWLAMAVAGVLLSAVYKLDQVYRAGMALLIVVIAKVFLIDMSDLQGLLRAVSFMGLGLALLGLAYLHQRIGNRVTADVS